MPHRFHRPVVGGALRRRRPRACRCRGHEGRRDAGRRGGGHRAPVHAALRARHKGAGLHQELPARRARERRPVYPCRDMADRRARRARARRRRLAAVLARQPGEPRALRGGGAALPRRALCRGGRRLRRRGEGRARRLDMVHRLGRLALSRRRGVYPRHRARGRQPQAEAGAPLGLERLLGAAAHRRGRLPRRGAARPGGRHHGGRKARQKRPGAAAQRRRPRDRRNRPLT